MNELTRAIVPADELRHAPGPEPGWRENWWMVFFDQAKLLYGMVYAGRQPNVKTAFVLFALFSKGNPLLILDRYDLTDGQFHEEMGGAGPVFFQCLEPFRKWKVEIRSDEVVADFEWEAVSAPYDWCWGEASRSRHYEQSGSVSGQAKLGGEVLEISGTAQRDRAWGDRSPNRIEQAWSSRILYSPQDIQHASIITVAGKANLFGYRIRQGVAELIDELDLNVSYGYEGGPPVSTELAAWAAGRQIADQQVRLLNVIPHTTIRNGTEQRQYFTFSEWFEGDLTGIGQLDHWWSRRDAIGTRLQARGNNGVWIAT